MQSLCSDNGSITGSTGSRRCSPADWLLRSLAGPCAAFNIMAGEFWAPSLASARLLLCAPAHPPATLAPASLIRRLTSDAIQQVPSQGQVHCSQQHSAAHPRLVSPSHSIFTSGVYARAASLSFFSSRARLDPAPSPRRWALMLQADDLCGILQARLGLLAAVIGTGTHLWLPPDPVAASWPRSLLCSGGPSRGSDLPGPRQSPRPRPRPPSPLRPRPRSNGREIGQECMAPILQGPRFFVGYQLSPASTLS